MTAFVGSGTVGLILSRFAKRPDRRVEKIKACATSMIPFLHISQAGERMPAFGILAPLGHTIELISDPVLEKATVRWIVVICQTKQRGTKLRASSFHCCLPE